MMPSAIEALPLRDMRVDLVIDATGIFKTAAKIAPYFDAGVSRVVSVDIENAVRMAN
jgi:glyceraldehyde 3-phosphate dehydrogenase